MTNVAEPGQIPRKTDWWRWRSVVQVATLSKLHEVWRPAVKVCKMLNSLPTIAKYLTHDWTM